MPRPTNRFLLAAAAGDIAAALLHFGCIAFGASWYRALGAGERMAQFAERGHAYPAQMAAGIGAVLLVWALYALSGAGAIPRLPFVRLVLGAIAVVLIVRGLAFVVLMPLFPGNGLTFWIASSATCLLLGWLHAAGLRQQWPLLRRR
ncbi:MAG TPA: hypothetical protein VLF18_18080 [Tahibacter sp.]|uniref:hypothetical protein n=1 Tax=Tahibacter sp. TaxID=2056211 RepID=UPI002CF64FF0|nr:hypothetical protein [Tahibacter sp.]HSX62096.1 hypothetical protein [Tahibacter sp.]